MVTKYCKQDLNPGSPTLQKKYYNITSQMSKFSSNGSVCVVYV